MSIFSRRGTKGPPGSRDAGTEAEPEALVLRRLAQESKKSKEEEEVLVQQEGSALDRLWSDKREELGPRLLLPAKGEIIRRAREAAGRGELGLRVDLGVDEQRLRAASSRAGLSLAEAVLSDQTAGKSDWQYLNRVGWLLQTTDGKQLSPWGRELIEALQGMGLSVRFTPYHVQESHAEPYVNARLELEW